MLLWPLALRQRALTLASLLCLLLPNSSAVVVELFADANCQTSVSGGNTRGNPPAPGQGSLGGGHTLPGQTKMPQAELEARLNSTKKTPSPTPGSQLGVSSSLFGYANICNVGSNGTGGIGLDLCEPSRVTFAVFEPAVAQDVSWTASVAGLCTTPRLYTANLVLNTCTTVFSRACATCDLLPQFMMLVDVTCMAPPDLAFVSFAPSGSCTTPPLLGSLGVMTAAVVGSGGCTDINVTDLGGAAYRGMRRLFSRGASTIDISPNTCEEEFWGSQGFSFRQVPFTDVASSSCTQGACGGQNSGGRRFGFCGGIAKVFPAPPFLTSMPFPSSSPVPSSGSAPGPAPAVSSSVTPLAVGATALVISLASLALGVIAYIRLFFTKAHSESNKALAVKAPSVDMVSPVAAIARPTYPGIVPTPPSVQTWGERR